jgi:hypothetical protein
MLLTFTEFYRYYEETEHRILYGLIFKGKCYRWLKIWLSIYFKKWSAVENLTKMINYCLLAVWETEKEINMKKVFAKIIL